MAGGIGEASAILTVAQLGISLSNTLIAYIGDVHDAPFRIQRIGNEILTTSERLKDIGELVDKNQQSRIFSEEGIHSAVRCSEECHKIIEDVKLILRKSGWQQSSTPFGKDEIDLSLFSTLRWPFLKSKLEVPRAELQRIKIDLSLLFSSAMALGGPSAVDQAKFQQDIPGLQRTRDWAARMAERAKERAQNRDRNMSPRALVREKYRADDEATLYQEFTSFKERRFREEEDERIKKRAAVMQAEQEARIKKEEEAQRELERNAVNTYKKQNQEIERRTVERKRNFQNELSRIGLEPEQIRLIIEQSNLSFGEADNDLMIPNVRPGLASQELPTSNFTSKAASVTTSSRESKWRWRPSWWQLRKATRDRAPELASDFLLSSNSSASNSSLEIETWMLDTSTQLGTEILPAPDWLATKVKRLDKGYDVWHRYGRLTPQARNAITSFIRYKNSESEFEWGLFFIGAPYRSLRSKLFGLITSEQMPLIIYRRNESNEVPSEQSSQSRLNAERVLHPPGSAMPNVSLDESSTSTRPGRLLSHADQVFEIPNGRRDSLQLVRPRVSFADRPGRDLITKPGVTANNPKSEPEKGEQIRTIETQKNTKKYGQRPRDYSDEIIEIVPRDDPNRSIGRGSDRTEEIIIRREDTLPRNRTYPRNHGPVGEQRVIEEMNMSRPQMYRRSSRESDSDASSMLRIRRRDTAESQSRYRSRVNRDRSREDSDGLKMMIRSDDALKQRRPRRQMNRNSREHTDVILRNPPSRRQDEGELFARRTGRAMSKERSEERLRPFLRTNSNQRDSLVLPDRDRRSRRRETRDSVDERTFSRRSTAPQFDHRDYASGEGLRNAEDNRALVLYEGGSRAGKSPFERSRAGKRIRTWESDEDGSPSARIQIVSRDRIPYQTGRTWASLPGRNLSVMHEGDASSEDDYDPFHDLASGKAALTSRVPELSDDELITQTLKRYTTFTGDEIPGASLAASAGLQPTTGHVAEAGSVHNPRAGLDKESSSLKSVNNPDQLTGRLDTLSATEPDIPTTQIFSSPPGRSYTRVDSPSKAARQAQSDHDEIETDINNHIRDQNVPATEIEKHSMKSSSQRSSKELRKLDSNNRVVEEETSSLKDADKKAIPPNARWTKVDRKLVSPEALIWGNERFEEREDYLVVLRVLTREEIERYALKTIEIKKETNIDRSNNE